MAVTHPHFAVQVRLLPDTLTRPVRLLVRSPVFQAGQRGSKPLRAKIEPEASAKHFAYASGSDERCPGGETDITRPSEGRGPGSTPGRGIVNASMVKRTSHGSAKSEFLVRVQVEALMPATPDGTGTALVRRTKWVRVPPPDLNDDAGAGRSGGRPQPDSKQVRLLPASC